MAAKSALIFGATGAVGKNLLRETLSSTHFTRVGEFGRRTTAAEQLEGFPREKLVQKVIDYENLDAAGLLDEKWDVIFITMGTTRKRAGSAENFVKIDRDYVINAALAAKSPHHKQQLIYCSSVGADSTSHALYTRSKGQTEHGLASLGYADTVIFRPGMLTQAERGSESRPAETIANVLVGAISRFSDAVGVPVATLAKSMCIAGALDSSAALPSEVQAYKAGGTPSVPEYTVIGNKGALKLAQTSVHDNVKS